MKLFLLLILLAGTCAVPSIAQTTVDSTDTQLWNETIVTFPIVKKKEASGKTIEKFSFFLSGNLRLGQNIRHVTDSRIGFGFVYKINKHVSFTPSYIYSAQQPAPTRRLYESRFRFAVGLENHWKKFFIDDRNLIEYRMRNGVSDSVRYRNRLRFVRPIVKNDKEIIAPFVADEVFYDFHANAFTRNELAFGVTRKLNSNVSADFFYMWQVNRSGSPKHLNVIGVNLKIKVD